MKNTTRRKQCETLYKLLTSLRVLSSINETNTYYDEPHYFLYNAVLNFSKSPLAQAYHFPPKATFTASGTSWFIREEALFKCFMESVERISLHATPQMFSDSFTLTEINGMSHILSPVRYIQDLPLSTRFQFVQGKNILTGKKTLLPAQLIYLSHLRFFDEPELSTQISTGAAAGETHQDALLRGIYEVVERDAVMCQYLLQIPAPRIAVADIHHDSIQTILSSLERYNLEPFVFDVTTDLGISTYMTLIIDRSGIGPAVSVGAKTHLHKLDAIIGSLEEAVQSRPFRRHSAQIYNGKIDRINPLHIATPTERALFWYPQKMLDLLKPLLSQKPQEIRLNQSPLTTMQQLQKLKDIFKKAGKDVYAADITLQSFKTAGVVMKAVIPSLQPLYFSERYKVIVEQRLSKVATSFGVKNKRNTIPHLFL